MTTVTIELPDDVYSAWRRSPEEVIREMRLAAAVEQCAQERISQSKGAAIAGLSRAKFIDELARRKIPVVQIRPEGVQQEVHSWSLNDLQPGRQYFPKAQSSLE